VWLVWLVWPVSLTLASLVLCRRECFIQVLAGKVSVFEGLLGSKREEVGQLVQEGNGLRLEVRRLGGLVADQRRDGESLREIKGQLRSSQEEAFKVRREVGVARDELSGERARGAAEIYRLKKLIRGGERERTANAGESERMRREMEEVRAEVRKMQVRMRGGRGRRERRY